MPASRTIGAIETYSQPRTWSRGWRIFYIATLPISGPLWMLSVGLLIVLAVVALVPIFWLYKKLCPWFKDMLREED